MRISSNQSYLQYRNKLPLIHIKNNTSPSQSGGKAIDYDNLVIDSIFGGNKEITRDDALMYRYNRENPVYIFEKDQPKRAYEASEVSQEFVDRLNQEQITEWDPYRLRFAMDFQGDDIGYNVDRLAAAYVAGAEHLAAHFSGEQLEGYLRELEDTVLAKATDMANMYAGEVGGFLEENGGSKEAEKIYRSIMSEYEERVRQYSDFAKNSSDYANLKDSPDQWLKNDIAYMAQELRKAYDTQIQGAQNEEDASSDRYSLQEITLANRFVYETKWGSVASRSSDEEQIGLQAGMLLLKANLFTGQSGVSDGFGKKMTAAVKNHIERQIDAENKWALDHADDPYFDIKKNPVFDKAEIGKVCERMLQTYEREKDYLKAIFDGIIYAQNRSRQKAEDSYYGTLDRYRYNYYWDQFFDNSSRLDSPAFKYMYVQGMDTRTSFQKIVDSWDGFGFHLTRTQDYALKIDQYSAQG